MGEEGYHALSEISYARKAIEAAVIRTGALYAHYRRMTPSWNDGICPRHQTFYEGASEPRCPVCFGTGYEGGFSRPVVQWMLVQNANQKIERTEIGYIYLRNSDSVSPFVPVIQTGDLLARVVREGTGYSTQDRYIVEGEVEGIRQREVSETITRNTSDHLDPEPEIVSYRFRATYLSEDKDVDSREIYYHVPFENPIWLADTAEKTR